MNDEAERAAMPPMRAARPKGTGPHEAPGAPATPQAQPEHFVARNADELREQLRASVVANGGTPPEPEPAQPPPERTALDALVVIAKELEPFDRRTRRKIMQTIMDLT